MVDLPPFASFTRYALVRANSETKNGPLLFASIILRIRELVAVEILIPPTVSTEMQTVSGPPVVTQDTGDGNPKASTPEKGEKFIAATSENIAQFLIELAATGVDQMYQ